MSVIETYFSKFPIITYNNFQTRDITERVIMTQPAQLVPENFYPYEVQNGMRADTISFQYYNDPTMDWLIYLTNAITDPYYGWTLSNDDFQNYLSTKYGSIAYSQQVIAFFRVNWAADPNPITVSYFDGLADALTKYYEPIWGPNSIIGYSRRQVDWTASTNQIINFGITMSSNATFTNNDPIQLFSNGAAYGTIQNIIANSSIITAQHILTNQPISANDVMVSLSNNSINATITSITTVTTNIPTTEAIFWEPVYYYDVENEKNATNRFIELLESNFALQTSETIRKALNS